MVGILYQKCDVLNAVAVLFDMLGGRVFRRERRGQNKIDIDLTHQVTRCLAIAGLEAGISHTRKPERLAIVKLGLLCVADVKLDVMYLFKPKRVLHRRVCIYCCVCLCDHDLR